MSDKEKVLIERLNADIAYQGDMVEVLGGEAFDGAMWNREEMQSHFTRVQNMLKSYKELILWSEEKEI